VSPTIFNRKFIIKQTLVELSVASGQLPDSSGAELKKYLSNKKRPLGLSLELKPEKLFL